ncbi:MAG: ImmA/IrrE family metallo-endopeptidase [Chloroflexi bacterium]|nr:ImmA/IrrE family metallo-endopeptidase [Chloroflexota bacterium]
MAARGQGREAARLLRSELGLGTGYVDIYQVIRELGIELYTKPFRDGLDGAYKRDHGRDFIFVNTAAETPLRHRFTAAHELGHAQLRSAGEAGGVFEDDVERDEGEGEEQEANSFAAHFLIDEGGAKQLCSTIDGPDRRVAATVRRFVVSAESAAIHLATLGLLSDYARRSLLARVAAGETSTRALLREHGMVLPQTPDFGEHPRLDPTFEQRVLDAYEQRWLRIDAVADLLQTSQNRVRALLEHNGLPVFEDEEADKPVESDLLGLLEP